MPKHVTVAAVRVAALAVAAALAARAPAGERYAGTWWSGVTYSQGKFEPGEALSGRPPLVSCTAWKAEKKDEGTLIRVSKGTTTFRAAGYLTADEKGAVGVSPKPVAGSYWLMKEAKSERGYSNAKDNYKGNWSRTSYTLEPADKARRGWRLGFRGGKLTVHPKNKGVAILSVTEIDAKEISGK